MDRKLDVEQLVHKCGIPKDLGVEFADFSPERVVASMPVEDRHLQPLGFLHGGVSVTLAESVAMVGGWLNSPPGKTTLSSSINATHLQSKRSGGRLWAVGIPNYLGPDKQIWEVDVRDESGERVCASRSTLDVVDLATHLVPR